MPAGGDIILASDINALIAAQPLTYTKTANTARISTTALADDPEILAIPLAVGTYEIELVLFFTLTTSTTQKIKTRWGFTGTWNNTIRACIGPGINQVAAPSTVTDMQSAAYQISGQDAIYDQAAGGTYGAAREYASGVVVTVAGSLSLQWAQVVSTAANTTVQAGTCMRVRKTA